ncbi:MAG: DUF1553 domain-containing protein [Planctomycetes bacterium]|nr:DUF1553 domain-containing protein [Planctomycetota bacterium]
MKPHLTLALLIVLPAATRAADVDIKKDIRPILAKHCVSCHGEEEQESGLRLDYGSLISEGGDRGASVVAGKPDKSPLYLALLGKGDVEQMPFELPKLSDEKIALVKSWIEQGAKLPKDDRPVSGRRQSDHWAFQPIVRYSFPKTKTHSNWPRNGIDWFVLAKLEAEGLAPSKEADRSTLIRRVYLDLLGILPTPREVAAFQNDKSKDAYGKLVDGLLKRPEYGERWGRHWLDIARYADSNGFTIDGPRSIWPYRDWVITALNRDLPFDQFVTEQLAGDLLPNATRDQIVATGFHRNTLINQEGGTDQEQFRIEAIVDRINTTGSAFLGLTIGCAQCHAHKYDPISQREFYKVFAVFNNCDEPAIPLPTDQQDADQKRVVKELAEVAAALKAHDAKRSAGQPDWEKKLAAIEKTSWVKLSPIEHVSKAGATLNKINEHSLLVGGNGNVPAQDIFTVVADVTMPKISAVRLETLTNPLLPKMGPGWAANGNFVLSEFELTAQIGAAKGAKPQKIEFASAETDWQQDGFGVNLAIDGDTKSGWAINGLKKSSINVNHEAVFVLKEPIETDQPVRLTFTLNQESKSAKYLIGSFRLSVAGSATPVPDRIENALAKTADKRDDTDKEFLTAAYARSDVSRRPLEARQTKLKAEEGTLKNAIPTTMVLAERKKIRPTHIHIRGNFLDKGAQVQPGAPAVLPPIAAVTEAPVNRLDFARWLFSKDHPLTSRVTVNRNWQRFFGFGIVETENDFGTQGAEPTHPKLLDWLSTEFMRLGWSQKQLHRLIVTSATYRQTSNVTPALLEKDPRNRLLARQSRIRLEAETVRDVALSASGLLSKKMLGPGVYPPQPKGIYVVTQVAKQWPESTGEDRYRRGVYTYFWRSSPYPMLPTFDAPDANGTCTRRNRSNTPLQALTLANDASFMEFVRGLADRILKDGPSDDPGRIQFAFRAALSRESSPLEAAVLQRFVKSQRKYFESKADAAKAAASATRPKASNESESATWTALARVVLNLDEFITRE